jgi:hypothetical protein
MPQAPRLSAVAHRLLSGLRLKSCPQGQLTCDGTPFPGRYQQRTPRPRASRPSTCCRGAHHGAKDVAQQGLQAERLAVDWRSVTRNASTPSLRGDDCPRGLLHARRPRAMRTAAYRPDEAPAALRARSPMPWTHGLSDVSSLVPPLRGHCTWRAAIGAIALVANAAANPGHQPVPRQPDLPEPTPSLQAHNGGNFDQVIALVAQAVGNWSSLAHSSQRLGLAGPGSPATISSRLRGGHRTSAPVWRAALVSADVDCHPAARASRGRRARAHGVRESP